MTAPEGVLVRYTSPGYPSSGVQVDITDRVLYSDAYLEAQSAAVPGSFHLTVKDPDQSLSFTSGGVIEVWIGGTKMFGGILSVPTRDFFFAADDTSRPVLTRRWSLDGVDFNWILDKRVLRNPSNYTGQIPSMAAGSSDRSVIGMFASYFDLGFSGGNSIDVTSMANSVNTFAKAWTWPTQGSTMRQVLDALVIESALDDSRTACVYWLDANAALNWVGLQNTAAQWGFSDMPTGPAYGPDGAPVSVPFIGFRDGSVSEDGSSVVNEVFVWGGGAFTGTGAVVLGHKRSDASVAEHGLWQMPEVHPGEDSYKSQAQVNARANVLLDGMSSGTAPESGAQGLVYPDMQYVLTWFAHDVPMSGGVRMHLIPGAVATLNLWSFGSVQTVGGTPQFRPFSLDVPLRQVRVTFPTLPSDTGGEPMSYVQFQGTFGIQMADPVWWWAFLRKIRPAPQTAPVVTTNNSSASFPFGSIFTDRPQEAPDGSRTDFSVIPTYQPGSLSVWLNGIPQTPGTTGSYEEVTPDAATGGTFRFYTAPLATDSIMCQCVTG